MRLLTRIHDTCIFHTGSIQYGFYVSSSTANVTNNQRSQRFLFLREFSDFRVATPMYEIFSFIQTVVSATAQFHCRTETPDGVPRVIIASSLAYIVLYIACRPFPFIVSYRANNFTYVMNKVIQFTSPS